MATAEEILFAYIHPEHMAYAETGEPIGRTIDLAREVSHRLGITPIFVNHPFARAMLDVKSGDVDAVISVFKSEERKGFLNYAADSEIFNEMVLFMPVGSAKRVKSIDDLTEESIGAVRGYFYGENVIDRLDEKVVFVKDEETIFKMLVEGRFDAALANRATGEYYLQQLGEDYDFGVAFTTLRKPVFIAFSKRLGERGKELADIYGAEISKIVKERTAPEDLLD